jgi:hypothetical protein
MQKKEIKATAKEGTSPEFIIPLDKEYKKVVKTSCACANAKIENKQLIVKMKKLPLVKYSMMYQDYLKHKNFTKEIYVNLDNELKVYFKIRVYE